MDDAKYIKEKLESAIETMRQACNESENWLYKIYKNEPEKQPSIIMHCLIWGLANASSSIESAMNHVTRMKEFSDVKLKKK